MLSCYNQLIINNLLKNNTNQHINLIIIMKRVITLQGVLLFLIFAGLNAQTPYYYYYGGEKMFLKLNTKRAFVSMTEENAAEILSVRNVNYQPLRVDKQSRSDQTRFWTVLNFEDRLSDEAYLTKLSEIKREGSEVIVAPYFKSRRFENIGLSHLFFVKIKTPEDTVLLRREAEKEFVQMVCFFWIKFFFRD